MEEYVFTFGCGQVLEGFYVRIKGKSFDDCRKTMLEIFDTEWAFQYSLEDWNNWTKEAKKLGIPLEEELICLENKEEAVI